MSSDKHDSIKKEIIKLFNLKIKGKTPNLTGRNSRHDGGCGHWLEREMGLSPNGNNAPDFKGFEMKTGTRSKTTFGDWSANYYIYTDPAYGALGRSVFLKTFGKPNAEKDNRHSWSGSPVPKVNTINDFGQILVVDAKNNILAKYFFSKDKRPNKSKIVSSSMQVDDLVIARWDQASISEKLERKFNQDGWFKCNIDSDGRYSSIVFGARLSFECWIEFVKSGDVFFDSGMYDGNLRPYSQWRASNVFWDGLIVSTH
jgi:hypothetical protein